MPTRLSLDDVETDHPRRPHAMRMVIACALNDPRIFNALVDLAVMHHEGRCRTVPGRALAEMINQHVHAHAVDAHRMAEAVILLTEPAASHTPQ